MVDQALPDFASLHFDHEVMPALFVGHGSPMNAVEAGLFSAAWRAVGAALPRPQAVLSVSAHWLTRGTTVTAMRNPRTIHDFYGFPQELYELQYPAPGAPDLAGHIVEMVGGGETSPDHEWGLDHGTWVVLMHMYPEADIPVLQLSIDTTLPPAGHYELGRQLAGLRREGVLVLGSGNIVHNLRLAHPDPGAAFEWALEFDRRIESHLLKGNHRSICEYESMGEIALLAVPTNDHFLPLLYLLGLQREGDHITFFSDQVIHGSLSMRSVLLHGNLQTRSSYDHHRHTV